MMRLTKELSEARANARIYGPLIIKLSDCVNDNAKKAVPLSSFSISLDFDAEEQI